LCFLVFFIDCWWFLVMRVDGGFLGDFLDWISWGNEGDFWWFFGILLVIFWCFVGFFGNVVDGGLLGDFLDRISWGSFVVISPALQKFPTREKKLQKKFLARALAKKKKRKKKEEE
jgi:hypothetical protein